jgi:hydrogenase maturation protease
LLQDHERLLIVDTIVTGRALPGTIHFFPMGAETPSRQLTSSHQISLPHAIALGRELGMVMPGNVDVLAVEAQDVCTLSEEMTPPVEEALEPAVCRVTEWIATSLSEGYHGGAETKVS